MSNISAFEAQSNTAVLSVTATSTASPIKPTPFTGLQPLKVLAYNAGPLDAMLSWNAVSASAVAILPTAGNPRQGVVIPAGAVMVITTAPDVFYAAIASGAGPTLLYLTLGEGV